MILIEFETMTHEKIALTPTSVQMVREDWEGQTTIFHANGKLTVLLDYAQVLEALRDSGVKKVTVGELTGA